MPRGSDVYGRDIVHYLEKKHGYIIVSHRGSHCTLRNLSGLGTTIPVHNKPLGKGLFSAIFRQLGLDKNDFLNS